MCVQQMMEEFDRKLNQVFGGGDPVVTQWFLVRESYLPFLLTGFYILFSTLIGPAIMRKRKPFDLRGPMIVYNFAIVACYIGIVTMAAINLAKATWEEICIRATVREGTYNYTVAYCAWVTYIIKYVEYLDTVFFILRKKSNQMTFLHIFHHIVVPLVGWTLLRTEFKTMNYIPTVLNSLVHIIMYTYYGLAAMGPQVQKHLWWKKYITLLQMTHLVLIFLFVMVAEPLTGCSVIRVSYNLNIILTPTLFYLFYSFYQNTFRQKRD